MMDLNKPKDKLELFSKIGSMTEKEVIEAIKKLYPETKKKKLVFCFLGGGCNGAFTAQVLLRIESATGIPIWQLAYMLVGTSAGGIIASALGAGYTAKEIVELFSTRAKDIFAKKKGLSRFTNLWGIADERYDTANLLGVLNEYLGRIPFGQMKTKVMNVAYELSTDMPEYFKSWLTEYKHMSATIPTASTAAASTYFSAVEYNGKLYGDGGLVGRGNPTQSAYAEMIELGHSKDEIKILTIGTGNYRRFRTAKEVRSWGLFKLKEVIDLLIRGTNICTHYESKRIVGKANYMMVDVELEKEYPMDKYTNIPEMIKKADIYWEEHGADIVNFILSE